MLTPILATDDPYLAAVSFTAAGWSLVFETPADSGDRLACVELAGAQVLLGTADPRFLATESQAHRGAGVEFHLSVPESEIETIHQAHTVTGSTTPLTRRPWGEIAFHTTLAGYRFLIAATPAAPTDQDAP